MTVSLYLVDDNLTFLTAVRRFLEQLPDVQVIGQSTLGADALLQIEKTHPDLILLDISLPDISGMQVASELSRWKQPPHIIFLSMYDGADYVALAEKLGAIAFVNKADFVCELDVLLPILATLVPKETCK